MEPTTQAYITHKIPGSQFGGADNSIKLQLFLSKTIVYFTATSYSKVFEPGLHFLPLQKELQVPDPCSSHIVQLNLI